MRDRLGVMDHGDVRAIELSDLPAALRDDLAPFAEAHQHVLLHRQIAFEEIRHRRRLNPQHGFRNRRDQFLGRRDRRRVLAEEHRAIDREMEIVDDIDQVDAGIVGVGEKLAVGLQRLLIIDQHVAVMPAQHVEMRRHVDEVAGIRHDVAQPVAGAQRAFREWRHLHQVNIEMQQARVIPRRRDPVERVFQQRLAFLGAGAFRRFAGGQIPHLPRRLVHDRLRQARRGRPDHRDTPRRSCASPPCTPCPRATCPRSPRAADSARRAPRSSPARPGWLFRHASARPASRRRRPTAPSAGRAGRSAPRADCSSGPRRS